MSLTNLMPVSLYLCRELPYLLWGVENPLLPSTTLSAFIIDIIMTIKNKPLVPLPCPLPLFHFLLGGYYKQEMSYSYLLKFIIIGDQSVGKSCILMRFIDGQFRLDSEATIGVEFASKTIKVGARAVKLQIWDTAGQQAYKSITRSYYRGTIGVILVYDITSPSSFDSAAKWLEEARNFATNENMEVLLVGNKSDLASARKVSFEQGVAFAKKNGAYFIESSAKSGENAGYGFELLTEKIVEKVQAGLIDTRDENGGVKLGQYEVGPEQPRSKCC